jgi:hypothetical protein
MKKFNAVFTKTPALNSLKKTFFIVAFALASTGAFAQDFEDDVNDEVPATPIGGTHIALGAALLLGGYFCFKGKSASQKA